MANADLKAALQRGEFLVAPGIFDMISARIADGIGFTALYATGFGTVASHLGIADAGLATYTDMLGRVGRFASECRTPLIADADTGYGGLLNVRHTVRGYEEAGVTAIQLEDQEIPKRCGHTPGRQVIPTRDMCLKIQVAVEARRSNDFLIIARTDARTTLGLDEAIARGKAYHRAGADIVFIESPEAEEEMIRIGGEVGAPLLANMVEGGRTPLLSAARLKEIGYSIAIYPILGLLPAAKALEGAFTHLKQHGDSRSLSEQNSYGFQRMCTLMGFPDVWEFERRWATTEPDSNS